MHWRRGKLLAVFESVGSPTSHEEEASVLIRRAIEPWAFDGGSRSASVNRRWFSVCLFGWSLTSLCACGRTPETSDDPAAQPVSVSVGYTVDPVPEQQNCFYVSIGGGDESETCLVPTGYATFVTGVETDASVVSLFFISPDIQDVSAVPALAVDVNPPWVLIERAKSDPAGVLSYSVGDVRLRCDLSNLADSCSVVD